MHKTNIEFVNHASVLISYEEIGILSDPWYNGSAFHHGWRLIYELDKKRIYDVLSKTTHIYISHEHPDHFNTAFFLNHENQNIIKSKNIEILFQYTSDKRICKFLKNLGFKVREFGVNEKVKISNDVETQIIKYDFIDSSLIIKTPDASILNLNDCPMKDLEEIKKFKKKYGRFDLLLTQFSYAAWKGGVDGKNYRIKAAEEKLKSVEKQAEILQCKSIVPFASFIYFSNESNYYMNDSINTPEKVKNYFLNKNLKTIILSPGEIQEVINIKQNQSSLDFWKKKFKEIHLNKKDKFIESVDIKNLKSQFEDYKDKVFRKNSKLLIFFLSKIKLMNFFQPIKINLYDHNKIYRYSIFKGLKELENEKSDITMHSQSLSFIFKNEFGFDTLTVNGCFEATQIGFLKSTKSLAVGSLNALGLGLNLSLIKNPQIIILFLKKIKNVIKNIKNLK